MNKKIAALALALGLLGIGASFAPAAGGAPGDASSPCNNGKSSNFQLQSTIAFSSTRDHVNDDPALTPPLLGAEVYLTNPDMTDPRRLTNNSAFDGFAALSPDGNKIVFDSTRYTGSLNSSDLFWMNTDGTEQTLLTRGSSATWSPDCKNIAFHASASYYASGGVVTGYPLRTDPGSATSDSDIFVANVDDLLAGTATPRNITGSWTVSDGQRTKIADDPDWSPDGLHIAFTAHDVGDEGPNWPARPFLSNTAEIYVTNADGTGTPQQVTHNGEEERGPAWSPDGTRIAYACRIGAEFNPSADFEICVMNADGSGQKQLTDNTVADLTPTWSPDGQQILFHRTVGGAGSGNQQLFIMNADGTQQTQLTFGTPTSGDGVNNLAHWGELRVKD